MTLRTHIFLQALIILFLNTAYSQNGWIQLSSETNLNLNCIYFTDANTGYIGADSGKVLKTTNGGSSWSIINTGIRRTIFGIQFPSSGSVGFAGTTNKTLRTSNGGASWDTTVLRGGHSISFINSNTGFALNIYSYPGQFIIYKTINAGLSWDSLGTPIYSPGAMNKIFFVNENTGFISGNTWSSFMNVTVPFIMKTTNSGLNWSMSYSGPSSPYVASSIGDIYFIGDNGFGLGFNGPASTPYLYKTSNSGLNWMLIQLPQIMASVKFINLNTGWLCGQDGRILFSSNGGSNWSDQTSGVTVKLNEAFMVNQNTGYIAGQGGTILKTTNGGVTALQPISIIIPEKFGLKQNYPNPFNPSTKISFDVPKQSLVKIYVYDLLGREIENIVNETLQPGTYEIDFNAIDFPSGVYYYILKSAGFIETKKMVVLK